MSAPVPAARAAAVRPAAVLVDVFETTLQLAPLAERFVAHSRPAHELHVFFARTIRNGMAMSMAGPCPPFAEVARAELRTTCGLVGADADDVLAGFRRLPVHPDVRPGLELLVAEQVPVYAFTHGSASIAEEALSQAGVRELYTGVLSLEELGTFKVPARAYLWGCAQAGTEPGRTALVAAHSWDTHGAVQAGLLAGLVTRLEGWVSDAVAAPHVDAESFDDVVRALLALPGAVGTQD